MSQPDTDPKTGSDDKTNDKVTGEGGTTKPEDDKSKADDKPKSDDPTAGLKKALAAERKLREGLEKEKREAELSKLPELEQAKAKLTDLENENAKLKTENMRRQVAMELGLPWNLAKRLDGETEQEMREDGADLLKTYKHDEDGKANSKADKANVKPPTNDAKKTGSSGGLGMNDLLRAAAGRKAK